MLTGRGIELVGVIAGRLSAPHSHTTTKKKITVNWLTHFCTIYHCEGWQFRSLQAWGGAELVVSGQQGVSDSVCDSARVTGC